MAQRKVRKPRARKPRAPKVKYDNEDVKPSKAIKTKQSQKQSITLTLPAQQAQQPAYFMNPQQPQQPQQPHQPYVINIQQPQQQPQHADVIREIFHEAQQPQGGNILGRAIDAGAQLGVAYAPAVRDVLGGVGQHVALPMLQATGRAVAEYVPAIAGGILGGAGNVAAAAVPVVGNILGQAGQTAAAAVRATGDILGQAGAGIRDMYIAGRDADEQINARDDQHAEQLRHIREEQRQAAERYADEQRRAAERLQIQEQQQREAIQRATQLFQQQHQRDTDILDQERQQAAEALRRQAAEHRDAIAEAERRAALQREEQRQAAERHADEQRRAAERLQIQEQQQREAIQRATQLFQQQHQRDVDILDQERRRNVEELQERAREYDEALRTWGEQRSQDAALLDQARRRNAAFEDSERLRNASMDQYAKHMNKRITQLTQALESNDQRRAASELEKITKLQQESQSIETELLGEIGDLRRELNEAEERQRMAIEEGEQRTAEIERLYINDRKRLYRSVLADLELYKSVTNQLPSYDDRIYTTIYADDSKEEETGPILQPGHIAVTERAAKDAEKNALIAQLVAIDKQIKRFNDNASAALRRDPNDTNGTAARNRAEATKLRKEKQDLRKIIDEY